MRERHAAPKTVLITGASRGIGRALAIEYARAGAHVAIAARRVDELERLASEIAAQGGKASVFETDLAEPETVFEAVRQAEHALGGLDMVIANAGVGAYAPINEMSWKDASNVLDVNVRGAIATVVAAAPIMLAQQRGHIVGVSSLAGRRGMPYGSIYCASKAAFSTFLESIRIELAPAKVRVTDVQPGFVDTDIIVRGAYPTPLMWSPEKASRVIAHRLKRSPTIIAFPWPRDVLGSILRLLPTTLYDRYARAVTAR